MKETGGGLAENINAVRSENLQVLSRVADKNNA